MVDEKYLIVCEDFRRLCSAQTMCLQSFVGTSRDGRTINCDTDSETHIEFIFATIDEVFQGCKYEPQDYKKTFTRKSFYNFMFE